MGALFSTKKEITHNYTWEPPTYNSSRNTSTYPQRFFVDDEYTSESHNYDNDRANNFIPKPAVIKPTSHYLEVPEVNLSRCLTNCCPPMHWKPMDESLENICVNLNEYDSEFIGIKQHFLSKTRKNLVNVESIYRVQNPHLMARYMLKKLKMKYIYGRNPQELYLFHGTKAFNIDSICEDNFDWRKHGTVIGHRFGQGVSFSPISHYASHYCDKGNTQKVMIVAKVLISETCVGDNNMELPPFLNYNRTLRYDSSKKADGKVIVKYNDDEYYPAYKIVFTINNLQAYFQKPKQSV